MDVNFLVASMVNHNGITVHQVERLKGVGGLADMMLMLLASQFVVQTMDF